jgi:hypothetical protein
VTATFLPLDTNPDPFTFVDQTGVALDTFIYSNTITISGINASATISITGGECSINGGAFASAVGNISNGDTVQVRIISSSSYLTTTSATLIVGGSSDTFSVTTHAPLTASHTGLTGANYTVSFTDTSTGGEGALSVTIDWQDGTRSTGNAGAAFTHTYGHASTYNITHTVKDSKNNSASEFITVTVPTKQKYDITVHVTDSNGTPIPKAKVYLKKKTANGWIQTKFGYTDTSSGTIIFADRAGNKDYSVIVYKSAVDFDGSKVGNQDTVKSGSFSLTADTTVNIQQGTPATDGPVSKPWKGDNGGPPIINITQ